MKCQKWHLFKRSLPQTALGVGKISVDYSATCSV